jgi:hypothetical protein
MRSGASVCQLRAVSSVPLGARTGWAPRGRWFSWVDGCQQGAGADELDGLLDLG